MNMQTTPTLPFYQPVARECELFETAYDNGLPLLLKGPTGCGKTRFVEHMAAKLGKPLYTVACHDDLSAADLIGDAAEPVFALEGKQKLKPAFFKKLLGSKIQPAQVFVVSFQSALWVFKKGRSR